jgi:hypothetical protein
MSIDAIVQLTQILQIKMQIPHCPITQDPLKRRLFGVLAYDRVDDLVGIHAVSLCQVPDPIIKGCQGA